MDWIPALFLHHSFPSPHQQGRRRSDTFVVFLAVDRLGKPAMYYMALKVCCSSPVCTIFSCTNWPRAKPHIYIYTQVECCKPAVTNLYVSTQYTQTNVVKNRENRRVDESMCSTLVFISVIREKRTRQLLGNKRGGNRERRTARHELII